MGWLHDYTPAELNAQHEREQRSGIEQNEHRRFFERGLHRLLQTLKDSKKKWHVFDTLPQDVNKEVVEMAFSQGYIRKNIVETKRAGETAIDIIGSQITSKGEKELRRLGQPKYHEERLSRN